jgi:flagellar biosynthetic protein FliR
MPLQIGSDELVALVASWMWPFVRISAMFLVAPLIGTPYVPARIRLFLAVMLAAVIAPVLPPLPAVDPFSLPGLWITVQQVGIGLAMGLALRLVFTVFEVAGQIIAQHMALHFASMVDPNTGVQVPMVAQLYILLASLVFLGLNGHLVMIHLLAESFTVLPIGLTGIGRDGFWHLASQMGWVFTAAMVFSLPAVASLLVVNLSFGVMTRAAPQLNIFAIGFPVTLILGFVIIFLSLPNAIEQLEPMFDEALSFTRDLVAGAL